jgi:hypothetical protein
MAAGPLTDGLAFKQLAAHPSAAAAGEIGLYGYGSSAHVVLPDGTHKDLAQPWVNVKDKGAACDDTTDDTAAINSAIAAAGVGGVVVIPGPCKIAGQISANVSGLTIDGLGVGRLRQTAATTTMVKVTASDVTIKDLELTGGATALAGYPAVHVSGTNAARILRTKLENLFIHDCTWIGIRQDYVTGSTIERCRIESVTYAGVLYVSALSCATRNNRVKTVAIDSGAAYGISYTRDGTLDLASSPRSNNCVVSGNTVEDILWEGIDSHGTEKMSIVNNIVNGCLYGIHASFENTGTSDKWTASTNTTITANVVDSGVDDGSYQAGILVTGISSTVTAKNMTVTGNVVRRHGKDEVTGSSGGIYVFASEGTVVAGNTVEECSPYGISIHSENKGFSVAGNAIVDAWGGAAIGEGVGIRTRGANNVGSVVGNVTRRGAKSATNVLTWGTRIQGSSGEEIVESGNQFKGFSAAAIFDPALKLSRAVHGVDPVVGFRETASTTLAYYHVGKTIEMNVASANTVTVPPNSTTAFPVGTVIPILQYGAGSTSVTPGAGVTIRAFGGILTLDGQYSLGRLRKIAADEWEFTATAAGRSSFSDVNYTVLASDRYVAQIGTLTASRTVTLPAANAVPAGTTIVVADESGTVTGSNTLVITRAGSDTINGGTTWTINAARGVTSLVSDGTSKWLAWNEAGDAVASISGGTVTNSDITLKQSTGAAPTAEGRVEWDTDDDLLKIGNGTGTETFQPVRRRAFSDTSITLNTVDRYVGQTGTLTAARTVTLMAANAVPAGTVITVTDESGSASSTNTITVQRAGADTINGGTGGIALNVSRGIVSLVSDGTSAWLAWIVTGALSVNGGSVTNSNITLKQSAAPTPISNGRLEWDSDDFRMVAGDGTAQRIFSDDTVVLARANHTGTQASSTISDFEGQTFAVANGRYF